MQRFCFSFFLLSFVWGSVLAVKDSTLLRKHEIGIYTGYLSLSSIDELYSFQKYSGGNVFGGVSYAYSSGKNIHQIYTAFSSLRRSAEKPSLPSYVQFYESRYKGIYSVCYDINYSFLRKVFHRNPCIYVSGHLFNHFNMSNDGNPEIYYTSIGAGLYVTYEYKRQQIGFASSFPFFSFVLRNNYHTSSAQDEVLSGFDYVKENGRFCFPDKLFILYAQVSYSYSLSQRFNVGMQYGFRYISDIEPRTLKSVSGLYSIGLTYKF
jgi:hypothetical protein